MRSIVLSGFFTCMIVGCAPSTANISAQAPTNASKSEEHCKFDTTHTAALAAADGVELVWDEGVKAFHWVFSDEHKADVKKAWDITKAAIEGMYDYSKREIEKK